MFVHKFNFLSKIIVVLLLFDDQKEIIKPINKNKLFAAVSRSVFMVVLLKKNSFVSRVDYVDMVSATS